MPRAEPESIALIVPLRNAGPRFGEWLDAVNAQTLQPAMKIAIDTESADGTADRARDAGFIVFPIRQADFRHGRARQMGLDAAAGAKIAICMTQDAIVRQSDAFERLINGLLETGAAIAYGRQLPRTGAGHIEAHARRFNYPESSEVRDRDDIAARGIRTSFCSNSFAAWDITKLNAIGGFDVGTIVNEDALAASRLVLEGERIAYCADACAEHSHAYSWREDFQRYFDIGVFHAQQPWIRERFGTAGGEGRRFVFSELSYLARRAPWLIPSAAIRTGLKLAGYRLGLRYTRMPRRLSRACSAQDYSWR